MSVVILEDPLPKVYREDVRRYRITIRDPVAEQLADPDWVKLELIKPGADDSPFGPFIATKQETGKYYVLFAFPRGTSLGEWMRRWTWDITIGTTPYPGKYESSLSLIDKTEEINSFG